MSNAHGTNDTGYPVLVSRAVLQVLSGQASGVRFDVSEPVELGRGLAGSPEFGDPLMSRRHARLALDLAGRLSIEDLGSRNGTLVNGRPISSMTALVTGDVIDLGDTTLHVADAPAARTVVRPTQLAPTGPDPGAAPTDESAMISRSSSFAAGLPVLSAKSLIRPVRLRGGLAVVLVVAALALALLVQHQLGDDPGLAKKTLTVTTASGAIQTVTTAQS